MSFVEREDIMNLVEDMFTKMVAEVVPHKRVLATPWPRLKYQDAMARYGKDNPDIRFGLELKDSHRFFSGFWFYRSTRVSLRPGGTFEG
jgi:aspartyl-tRNA synthetase